MFRKAILGVAAAVTLGGLTFGHDFFSYVRTGIQSARSRFRAEVPVEFEIERARHEVERLLPEVRKSLHLIAEEQVEVAQLQSSIDRKEKLLTGQEHAILSLSGDLQKDDSRFKYAGHQYSRKEVEKDLAERFNRFKIAEETVKRERQVLAAKEISLSANRETLESMLSQRKTLEAELERLQARLRTVDARKQISGLKVDHSQLNRVKTLISTIEKRLDVEDAVLAAEGDLNGLIPVEHGEESTTNASLTAEIDAYFHTPADQRVVDHAQN